MHEDRGRGYFMESDLRRGLNLSRSLSGVFGLMFLGLLASAFSAFFTLSSPFMSQLVFGSEWGFWAFLLAPILLVIFAFPRVWNMSMAGGCLLFFVYALINGVTLSVIFLAYDMGTITLAFLSAAGMFGVMALYGVLTKSDLSGVGSFLIMGLFGVIIATVINLFLASSMLDAVISYAGIAIFLGLTAYDVQRIRRMANEQPHLSNTGVMVLGALHLYLNFINIFLFILRLMARRR